MLAAGSGCARGRPLAIASKSLSVRLLPFDTKCVVLEVIVLSVPTPFGGRWLRISSLWSVAMLLVRAAGE